MIEGNIEQWGIETSEPETTLGATLYHFLHVQNLEGLFSSGFLYSDAHMRRAALPHKGVGYSTVKQTRLMTKIPGAGGLTVGQCVPFYYGPKMPMLYVIYKANSPLLSCHDGQPPIVYLCFKAEQVFAWAKEAGLRTFITDGNAAAEQSIVYTDMSALRILNWEAITASAWGGDHYLQTKKLSEFLVEDRVDLTLLAEIGVMDVEHQSQVRQLTAKCEKVSNVPVNIHREWYF